MFVWMLTLVLVASISLTLAADTLSGPSPHPHTVHAQQGEDWDGSRYRCVVCHTQHDHEVVMPHPLRPGCDTCHQGAPTKLGCPSCHGMHTVEYPHETYPTCSECHTPEENVEQAAVQTTSTSYLGYLFNRRDFFLSDDSALE
jgi:hypothetical protein